MTDRAKNSAIVVLKTGLLLALLAGCISTTTSTNSRPMKPTGEAGDINYQLGVQYYRSGKYNTARDRLERAIEQEPKNANAHSALAMTFVQLGNNRLAKESFDRSTQLAPNSINVRNAYAVYLCQQEQYDDAQEQFDRAINIRTNDQPYIMMTNAGVCVAKKPDLPLAEKYFRDALAVRPSYGEALIQLAALKQSADEHLSARAFLQRFFASNPPSSGVLYLAVQIETSLADDRAATDYLNQLLREFPESAEARLMLQQGQGR